MSHLSWFSMHPTDEQFEKDFKKIKNKLVFDQAWVCRGFVIPPTRPVMTKAATTDPLTGTRYVFYYFDYERDDCKVRRVGVAKRLKN